MAYIYFCPLQIHIMCASNISWLSIIIKPKALLSSIKFFFNIIYPLIFKRWRSFMPLEYRRYSFKHRWYFSYLPVLFVFFVRAFKHFLGYSRQCNSKSWNLYNFSNGTIFRYNYYVTLFVITVLPFLAFVKSVNGS